MFASFNIEMFVFAALGAFVLWLRQRYGRNFEDGIDKLISEMFSIKVISRLLVYTALGATIGIVMTAPATYPQAFAAGLGWTGLVGGVSTQGKFKSQKAKP